MSYSTKLSNSFRWKKKNFFFSSRDMQAKQTRKKISVPGGIIHFCKILFIHFPYSFKLFIGQVFNFAQHEDRFSMLANMDDILQVFNNANGQDDA